MNDRHIQPAIIGGLVMGVLSALPIVSAGNLCCCLWVVSGGIVAAYVLQQGQAMPITLGDGALIGLFAGLAGAFVYLVLSIPITILIVPMERLVVQRLLENGDMPPEFRESVGRYIGGPLGIVISFMTYLVAGTIFSTIGGVLGAVIFRKPLPPATPSE